MMEHLLAAAMIAAAAQPALAQDTPDRGFGGFRVEGRLGYDNVGGDDGFGRRDSSDGLLFGGGVGADYDFGRIVLGGQVMVDGSTISERLDLGGGDSVRLGLGRDIELSGRLGAKVAPRSLVYVMGGYTNLELGLRANAQGVTDRISDDFGGFRIGGGFEQKLSRRTFAKAEYRYSKYGLNFEGEDLGDFDRHQVLVGVGLRF